MSAQSLLVLLLVAGEPVPARPPSARVELETCAARIEELKARGEDGAELERLLRRAAELAGELERGNAEVRAEASPPLPEELRERADAARDEADRLGAEVASIDVRLQDARRGEAGETVQRASVGDAPGNAEAKLRELRAARAALVLRRDRALAQAARLEREARATEEER